MAIMLGGTPNQAKTAQKSVRSTKSYAHKSADTVWNKLPPAGFQQPTDGAYHISR